MPASTQTEPELHLLVDADQAGSRDYWRSGIGSVLINIAAFALIGWLWGKEGTPPKPEENLIAELRHATRLVAPVHISQPTTVHSGVTKEVKLRDLLEHSRPAAPPAPKRFVAPPAQRSPRPQAPVASPPPPPQIEATNRPVSPPPGVNTPAPPPRIQAEEPKLAFETPGQSSSTPRTNTLARIVPPSHSLQDALHSAARSANQGGADVGEMEVQIAPPQIPGMGPSPQGPQRLKSTIAPQILSDTHGVDFRPYLIRVLTAVRRNWAAVVPESARLGRQGVTILQFAIARDGSVPRLVISIPSGTEALDRAAVAGVSASNPFPPLPAEYPGTDLRLQLVFTYNMPKQ